MDTFASKSDNDLKKWKRALIDWLAIGAYKHPLWDSNYLLVMAIAHEQERRRQLRRR